VRFSRKRAGATALQADAVEVAVLQSVVGDLLALLDDASAGGEQDPLAAVVGLPAGDVRRPEDPALARLLPDAYGDDPQASAEFRRYTQADLQQGKRAAAGTVLATLAPLTDRGGSAVLDREQADAWLGCLNDLRLVLGVRLDVTEETDLDPPGDDPRGAALQLYGWLGWLQESLLSCVDPLPPPR
jgi:hypothetical protein